MFKAECLVQARSKSVAFGQGRVGLARSGRLQCTTTPAETLYVADFHDSANGVTSDKVPLNFAKSDGVKALSYRLHELVTHEAARNTIAKPTWQGEGPPARGPQMASIVLDVLKEQLNGDLSAYDTDRSRLAEDMDNILQKAAKEWAKAAKAEPKAGKKAKAVNS